MAHIKIIIKTSKFFHRNLIWNAWNSNFTFLHKYFSIRLEIPSCVREYVYKFFSVSQKGKHEWCGSNNSHERDSCERTKKTEKCWIKEEEKTLFCILNLLLFNSRGISVLFGSWFVVDFILLEEQNTLFVEIVNETKCFWLLKNWLRLDTYVLYRIRIKFYQTTI